jgi:outer membrane lipoprotein-sorting protein
MFVRQAAFVLVVLLLGAAPALAASPNPPTPALSTADQATVARAVAYLQGITSAKGRFVQTDQKGGRATGTLYLDRPGRARFEYDPPAGLLITCDGRTITVGNSRLKTLQHYPLSATPLGLFLGKEIRLDRGARVVAVTTTASGFSITATDLRGAAQGQIVLSFADGPIRLIGWTIIDAQRRATRVDLEGLAPAGDLPASLFVQQRP